jgi:sensor histidine kinase YesM
MQIIAMATAAPLATFLAYWITSGGLQGFIAAPARVSGFFVITLACILIGIPMALGTMVRERDARNHSQALDLALAKEQLERQTSDAKLALLQAQIEPHFLFNTLANVQELVDTGSPRAAPVFKALIAYLRATMPQLQKATATLGDEVRLVRSYLELMAMRMPDRLRYDFALDEESMSMRFPAMALLTLVENAVRHGIDPSEDGGTVTIGSHRDPSSGKVNVWVTDSGVGMQETSTPGTGLANLRQRLAVFFGPGSQLEFSEPAGGGLRVDLRFTPAATV